MTRAYEDLKYRSGSIVTCSHLTDDYPGLNVYKVALDFYPSSYQLNQHLIPVIFAEEELQFEDKDKERDWKLKQVLK